MPYADQELRKKKAREYYLATRETLLAQRHAIRRERGIPKKVPLTDEKRKEYHREWNRLDRLNPESKQRAVMKKSREKHYEKKLAGNRKWTLENPEKQRNIRRRSRYGVTPEIYQEMSEAQDHQCFICKEVKPLAIDHCHKTGKVRGLICRKCNTGIGMLQDRIDLVENALSYLKKFEALI